MNKITIHTQIELMEVIQQIGFLPLLDSGIRGYSAEEMADEDCRYVVFPRWWLGLAIMEMERSGGDGGQLRLW